MSAISSSLHTNYSNIKKQNENLSMQNIYTHAKGWAEKFIG